MNIIKTEIPDVIIFEPKIFGDNRGFFYESFNSKFFDNAIGRNIEFLQDNHSQSQKGVLRGLHYQVEPYAQGKLVRCVEGEVYDVAVDIRRSSPTFGKWVGAILSAQNKRQLWIPEGFAHGFMSLTDTVQFVYKATSYYAPQSERSILWSDSDIGIEWPKLNGCKISLSDKDMMALPLSKAEVYN